MLPRTPGVEESNTPDVVSWMKLPFTALTPHTELPGKVGQAGASHIQLDAMTPPVMFSAQFSGLPSTT